MVMFYVKDELMKPFAIQVYDELYYVLIDSKIMGERYKYIEQPISAMTLLKSDNIVVQIETHRRLIDDYHAIEDVAENICWMQSCYAEDAIENYFKPLLLLKTLSGTL